MTKKKKIEQALERNFGVDKSTIDVDARTVEIAFSSEEPYERSFGSEVLDHSPQSMRLGRLDGGAAVLVNHDHSDQVGVVESARIDSDRIGRSVIRFSRSQRGEEIFQDVVDGIRNLVSVGYRIHDYDITERKGQSDLVRVTDWEPYELSIVPIPADPTVGVGRAMDESETLTVTKNNHTDQKVEARKMEKEDVKKEDKAPKFDTEAYQAKLRTDETRRVDSIRSMADKHDGLDVLATEAVSDGMSAAEFNKRALEIVGERNSKAKQSSSHDGRIDLSRKDEERFSIGKLMHALGNPNDAAAQRNAQHELEIGIEAAKGFGSDFQVRGAFVPEGMLDSKRTLNVGTPANGGNLVAKDLLAGSYIEVLRNSSALVGAGARVMSGLVGNIDIPKQLTGATSTWITAEDGDATASEATFGIVPMTPKDLACYTEMTRRSTQQMTPSVEAIVVTDLAIAQALGIDLAGLYGAGTGGVPRGITNQTGINTFALGAANPTYAEIVRMIKEVMADNALLGSPRFLLEASGWEALSTTSKQAGGIEGNFILSEINDRIKGYPYTNSQQITAGDYFFGDFSQMLIGEWGGLEINVDPYTHSLKGRIRYVTFKTTDVAVRHPESFCFVNDGV